jgi:hypothetical protein
MQGFNHIAGGMVFTVFASFHDDVNVFETQVHCRGGGAALSDVTTPVALSASWSIRWQNGYP